jgi:hypothetical protein
MAKIDELKSLAADLRKRLMLLTSSPVGRESEIEMPAETELAGCG